MKLYVIKTKEKVFCTDQLQSTNYSSGAYGLMKYFYDGEQAENSFHKDWIILKKIPETVQGKVINPDINHRYVLIDKSMKTEVIKDEFKREEVAENFDYEWVWKKEYRHLSSLYKLESDKMPSTLEDIKFEIEVICELDSIKEFPKISYSVNKSQWPSDGLAQLTEKDINYQLIDKIVFPEILLPTKPCSLSSEDTYKIVRQYIRDNIDPSVAEITSNYEFCFTVKKKILLSEPIKYTVDVNNSIFQKRKRKAKMVTKLQTDRQITIFEMTHAKSNYKGYTVIKGFNGKDHLDLKEKIDFYLESLMEYINSPVVDCPNCKGCGVIINSQVPERQKVS